MEEITTCFRADAQEELRTGGLDHRIDDNLFFKKDVTFSP